MYKQRINKRFFVSTLVCLLLISLTACNKTPATQQTEPSVSTQPHPHQELTATQATGRVDATAQWISISQIGLENVVLCDASEEVALQDTVCGQVYLLGDDVGIKDSMDHYLVAQLGDQLIAKDLLAYEEQINHEGSIDVCDFDGDGDCEILVQQCVGMIGGYGCYLSRVFDIKDDALVEMFHSEPNGFAQDSFGFAVTLLAENQYKVTHEATGYSETFSLDSGAAKYFSNCDADTELEFVFDSFYEFVPNDIDGDGIAEICCKQYTWYASHVESLGIAETVWKYDQAAGEFRIIRAAFKPFEEENA